MNWNDETANIIYVSNDGYAGHLAASLFSLLYNNRNIPHMDIYILSVQMSRDCQKNLRKVARRFHRDLKVYELGSLKDRFPYEIDTRGFDISAMGRLFAAEILPQQVKKALYLDCDTIVCSGIRPLYGTELGEMLLGMVMEPTVYPEMKAAIGMGKDDAYYNSGVLLMNLSAWRTRNVLKTLLDYYGSHAGSLFACDQDTINGALKGRILTLPPKYNYFTNYRYFHYRTLTSLCPAYGKEVSRQAFREAGQRPVIIHYLGDERPWIAGNHNHFRRLYEHYLKQTPWKGMKKQKGRRLYMHMWWVFNHISYLCPPFRLLISRRFGMKLIDRRKK